MREIKGMQSLGRWVRLIRLARRWRDTQGVSETVGAIFGILLLVFGLTGSLGAYRLWQTHQALVHAASVALRSEEQQGCWTTSTSQAVGSVAQGAGLSPQGIQVLQYTGTNTAAYGQPVTVALGYTTNVDYLFGGLSAWTEQASLSGSSFYVPAAANGSNNGCIAPKTAQAPGTTAPVTMHMTLNTAASEITQQSYTATGALTGSGIALANTTVVLSDGTATLGSTRTNSAGQYSITFTAPSTGSYIYTALAAGATATQSVTVKALWYTTGVLPGAYTLGTSNVTNEMDNQANDIAPGPGSQPNGIWFVAAHASAPAGDSLKIQAWADDGAVIYVNGQSVGTVTYPYSQPPVVLGTLTSPGGSFVVAAEVTNNNEGNLAIVPDNSGLDNPTGFYLAITDTTTGKTILTTADPSAWQGLFYPSSPPPGAITSGDL